MTRRIVLPMILSAPGERDRRSTVGILLFFIGALRKLAVDLLI